MEGSKGASADACYARAGVGVRVSASRVAALVEDFHLSAAVKALNAEPFSQGQRRVPTRQCRSNNNIRNNNNSCHSVTPSPLICNSDGFFSACAVSKQGDPLGPFLFCLAIHPILCKIKEACPNLVANSWYLDDGVVAGP